MKHLNEKIMNDIEHRIWTIEGALMGLGGLFEQCSNKDFCFDPNELFGIGQLLKSLSREAARFNDILKCGYDSLAQKEAYCKVNEVGESHNEYEEGDVEELIDKNIESLLNLLRDTLKKAMKKKLD